MNTILRMAGPDAGGGGSAKPKTAAEIQAELDAANAIIVTLTSAKAVQTEREKLIQEKMLKGLSRPQAISVLDRQDAYDKSPIAQGRAKKLNAAKTAAA